MGASPSLTRQPLRLVSTKGMGREDWLRVRKNGIGSSDAAAAVGLNPYQSMLELWLIKTGRDAELPQIDPSDDSQAKQLEAQQQQAGICQDALDAAARVGFGNGFSEESVEDTPALVEEFFAEETDAPVAESSAPTPTGGLKGKLGQKANGQAAPVTGAA